MKLFNSQSLKVVAVLLAVIGMTGCGTSSTHSSPASSNKTSKLVEQQIATGIFKQLHARLTVSCPANTDTSKGATFTCTAQNPTTAKIAVDVTRVDTEGNVLWKMHAINTNVVEKIIRDGAVKQRQSHLAVLCPDVIEMKQGLTFKCEGKDANGTAYPVTVTVTDSSGHITWVFTGAS